MATHTTTSSAGHAKELDAVPTVTPDSKTEAAASSASTTVAVGDGELLREPPVQRIRDERDDRTVALDLQHLPTPALYAKAHAEVNARFEHADHTVVNRYWHYGQSDSAPCDSAHITLVKGQFSQDDANRASALVKEAKLTRADIEVEGPIALLHTHDRVLAVAKLRISPRVVALVASLSALLKTAPAYPATITPHMTLFYVTDPRLKAGATAPPSRLPEEWAITYTPTV